MRYKPKNVAALHLALGAGSNAGQCRPIDRGFRKDRWRTSEGDNLGREFGDNDPAGSPSRKCRDAEQGRRQTSRAKTIGSGSS